jgi:hypothetical protein
LANGVVGEKAQKVVQFFTMFHLLQQGCPMLEYESLRLLFEFLEMPKNNKKHYNDIWLNRGKIHAPNSDEGHKSCSSNYTLRCFEL